MRTSQDIETRRLTAKSVVRDKEFYLKNLEIEESLLTRATSIAERMFATFIRENNVQVKVDVDDLVNKIVDKLGPSLQYNSTKQSEPDIIKKNNFSIGNGPVVVKSEKIKIQGEIGKTKKTTESTGDALKALEDFSL